MPRLDMEARPLFPRMVNVQGKLGRLLELCLEAEAAKPVATREGA